MGPLPPPPPLSTTIYRDLKLNQLRKLAETRGLLVQSSSSTTKKSYKKNDLIALLEVDDKQQQEKEKEEEERNRNRKHTYIPFYFMAFLFFCWITGWLCYSEVVSGVGRGVVGGGEGRGRYDYRYGYYPYLYDKTVVSIATAVLGVCMVIMVWGYGCGYIRRRQEREGGGGGGVRRSFINNAAIVIVVVVSGVWWCGVVYSWWVYRGYSAVDLEILTLQFQVHLAWGPYTTFYSLIRLPNDASPADILQAYMRVMREWNMKVAGGSGSSSCAGNNGGGVHFEFEIIGHVVAVLRDSAKKSKYDYFLARGWW